MLAFIRFPLTAAATTAVLALALTSTCRACSVCGCSLSSDWAAQGYATQPGLDLGFRLEYFEQSDLRSGTSSVDRANLTLPNGNEIQQRTLNRNYWSDLNYTIDPRWSVSLQLPFHDRFHTTIAAGDTAISTSHATGPGDVRLLARYQLQHKTTSNWGILFGLKLPTGGFAQNFASGPQTGGLLDRGLQLGTGTTDLIAGVSWFGRPAATLGTFAQVTLNQPLAARNDFLPSSSLTFSSGVRWLNASRFTPQLQVNVKAESRERGGEADTPNSGGTIAYLSPGVTAEITANSKAFIFVQLPVYQRVNGLQLEPKWLFSTGIGCRW